MIVGIGIDLCEVARLEAALTADTGDRFAERVFTAAERAYCDGRGVGRFESYAARFAAKEAVAKALGTGIGRDLAMSDVEVVVRDGAPPTLQVVGTGAATARERGVVSWHLSLAHSAGVAAAVVVAEGALR